MKRGIVILLIVVLIINAFNGIFLSTITGFTSNSQGTINLSIGSTSTFCGDSTCQEDETCSTCAEDCGSCPVAGAGGGGGGFTSSTIKTFEVDPEILKVLLGEGESFKKSIIVTNTKNYNQSFRLLLSQSISSFVTLSERSFVLGSLEENEVFLTFRDSAKRGPGVYVGNLIIETNTYKKIVNIVNTIKSKNVLFDVTLDVPIESRIITKEDDFEFQVTLFNIGDLGKTEINVEYLIKNFEGKIVHQDSEVIEIERQISFSKVVKFPEDLEFGEYIVIVNVRYGPSFGTSSYLFQYHGDKIGSISKTNFLSEYKYIIGIGIVVLGIIAYLIYSRPHLKFRARKKRSKVKAHKVYSRRKPKRSIKNLFGKSIALDSAYDSGYISKKSYMRGKKKLSKAK